MVLTALLGAIGFCTRFPLGHDERAWEAFRTTPATFPLVGYLVGVLVAVPFTLPLPDASVAFLFPLFVLGVTGINHLDGVADLGDAAVVHGTSADRRRVLKDTTTGVGAVAAVSLTLAGLALAGLALARLPPLGAVGIVVASEVAAKLGMAAVACFGTPAHDGLGSQVIDESRPASFVVPVLVATPTVVLTWPHPASLLAVVAGTMVAFVVLRWADSALGGANGDVFGAVNEGGRLVALHVGVIAWTLL